MRLIPRELFKRDRFFDDIWSPAIWDEDFMGEFFAPRVDVKDCKDHYEIHAELPGVEKDDIKVSLADGVLILEAELKHEDKEEKEGKFLRQERRYGRLMRRFDLGGDVNEDDIDARFENGVLHLKAPKHEPRETAREHRIDIH